MNNTITSERYAIFAGMDYYPSGGWWDYQNCFSDDAEARTYASQILTAGGFDWYHVVDLKTKKIIAKGYKD